MQTNWGQPSAISHQPSAISHRPSQRICSRDAITKEVINYDSASSKDGGRISLDRTMDPTKPALKPAFKVEIDGVDRSGVGVFHRCARVCFMHETKAHYHTDGECDVHTCQNWHCVRGNRKQETGNTATGPSLTFFQSWGSSMLQPTLDSRIL